MGRMESLNHSAWKRKYCELFNPKSSTKLHFGCRWLIAKHRAVEVLRRLRARQRDICDVSLETTLEARVPHLVFRFSDGYQPPSLVATFCQWHPNNPHLR